MNNEDISSDTFREFVHNHAKKRGVTFRQIGQALGMKPAYFSDLLHGRKRRSAEFLNALANYLNVPRVEVYKAAGLLQITEHEALTAKIESLLMNEPTVRQALEMFVGLDRNDMLKIATWIIMISVDLMQSKGVGEDEKVKIEGLEVFPERELIAPPSLLNMLSQVVSQYFRIGSKGQLMRTTSKNEAAEYDGIDIDKVEDEGEQR